MSERSRGLALGLGLAYALFTRTFTGPRERFWGRMTATGLALGSLALAAEPGLRRTRLRPRDLGFGATLAVSLYGVFQVGDRLARRIMPRGGQDIADVYALRRLEEPGRIAARLVLVIAPAEELFWRGLVQDRLAERLGPWPGAVAAALAYGGAHAATRNPTLIGAATAAGAFWSALRAAGVPMGALIASHALWDVLIFLLAPTAEA